MKGILGRKVGMTQVFTTDGKLIPVTVIEVKENVITQIKTVEKDGYNSIQLGAFDKKKQATNRSNQGHAKKANTEPKRFLKEIRGLDVSTYSLGQTINVDLFEKGEIVDVTGTSKGKGFAGVIKRWNQSRGPMTHGSDYHRKPGSLGPMRPMRVLKGKKLPGQLGNEQVTIQNLEIIDIDKENEYILVSGNVPGPKGSFVLVRSSIKNNGKNSPAELVSYIVEEVAPEVEQNVEVEEVVETSETQQVEEVVETTKTETTEEVNPEVETEQANESEVKEAE